MSDQIDLNEYLEKMNDTARKNYAMTELLAQTFSAFIVATNNKSGIEEFIKSTSVSDPSMESAHQHAKTALLKILDSVKVK